MNRLTQVLVAATMTWAPIAAQADSEQDSLPLDGSTEVLGFTTDEGSWLSIDVAPEGDSLVFDLLGDLYRLPIDGGEAIRITSGLGYDSQPVISPDGQQIAFISDRAGATNLWVANIDGTDARQLSSERHAGMISPQWSSNGNYLIVTRVATDTELVMFHVDGGSGVTLTGSGGNERFWGVGVETSPDGEHLYFAEGQGSRRDIPASQISRYAFATGDIEPLTQGEGGAFRPVLSPDGQLMVYGTRFEAKTGLRIRDLVSGADRWLTYPIQRDAQENFRPPSRDLLPGYSFTPDGQQVIFNAFGKIWRVDVATGDREEIPFTADVALDIGPDLTAPYRVPQGDLTATLIQDPRPSPDKSKVAASVLTKIYVMDDDGKNLKRLTRSNQNEFKPIWSPDGRWIAYTTWSHARGGHIYKMRSDGKGKPRQLTDIEAFYTDLAFSPDGSTIVAMRGNEFLRNQTFSEFGGLRIPLELISLPAKGGEQTVIRALDSGRYPHFGPESDRVYLTGDDGLFSLTLSGTDHRDEMTVNAPRGNQRGDDPPGAEVIYLSLIHISEPTRPY